MRKIRFERPSPALVIAVAAMFVALGGTAAAITLSRNSVGTKQLKAAAVTTKKIKNGAVTAAKLGSGAVTATKLGTDARAYAYVNADGSLVAAQSSGVVGVTHTPASGIYCLDLAFQPDVGVVSTRVDEASFAEYAQVRVPEAPPCAASAEAAVYTLDVNTFSTSDAGFSAIFN
jgi:hypothetical protein